MPPLTIGMVIDPCIVLDMLLLQIHCFVLDSYHKRLLHFLSFEIAVLNALLKSRYPVSPYHPNDVCSGIHIVELESTLYIVITHGKLWRLGYHTLL